MHLFYRQQYGIEASAHRCSFAENSNFAILKQQVIRHRPELNRIFSHVVSFVIRCATRYFIAVVASTALRVVGLTVVAGGGVFTSRHPSLPKLLLLLYHIIHHDAAISSRVNAEHTTPAKSGSSATIGTFIFCDRDDKDIIMFADLRMIAKGVPQPVVNHHAHRSPQHRDDAAI